MHSINQVTLSILVIKINYKLIFPKYSIFINRITIQFIIFELKS